MKKHLLYREHKHNMALEIDAGLNKPFAGNGGQRTVEVTLNTKNKRGTTRRDIVVLVDTSISMSRSKIQSARDGLRRVLEELNPADNVAILAFDRDVDVVVPFTQWGEAEQSDIFERVVGTEGDSYDGKLVADGGTNIEKALQKGWDQFETRSADEVVSRDIVLLSDGRDSTDLSKYEEIATDIGDDGISIIAGGIGHSYNEDVMLALARESGGEPYNLDESDDITDFLAKQIVEAGAVLASNPIAHVEMDEDFVLVDEEPVVFTKPQNQSKAIQGGRNRTDIELERLTGGKPQQFSFVVLGPPKPTGYEYQLMDLSVSDGGDRVLASESVSVRYEGDGVKKTAIEKRRAGAKVATDIVDSDVSTEKVRADIDKIRERGWTKQAEDLEKRLDTDEHGDKIEDSKRPVPDHEEED